MLLLLTGALLAPGRRTVTAALRILGREREEDSATYHRVLARACWSSREVAGRLLHALVEAFVTPGAEVVIGLDDTIERRWGPKIKGRAIYRDPVRSSKGHVVKTSGLRWLAAMLITPVPWAGRLMALPILAALAPHACFVTRLRLDANLFAPAPPRRKDARGRPPLKGKRLPKLAAVLADPATGWRPHTVALWYGKRNRASRPPREPPSGTMAACQRYRSDG